MRPSEKQVYGAIHTLIRHVRGCADEYLCIQCDSSAHEWAHIHGTDKIDLNNYRPMCRSCHRYYDESEDRKRKIGLSSAKLDAEDIIKIRKLYAEKKWNQKELAFIYGISQGQISSIINKRWWAHVEC